MGIAAQLPDQVGAAVLEVARDAFVWGMVLAAAICAFLAVAVAFVALFTLRDVGPAGHAGVTSEPQGAVAGGV